MSNPLISAGTAMTPFSINICIEVSTRCEYEAPRDEGCLCEGRCTDCQAYSISNAFPVLWMRRQYCTWVTGAEGRLAPRAYIYRLHESEGPQLHSMASNRSHEVGPDHHMACASQSWGSSQPHARSRSCLSDSEEARTYISLCRLGPTGPGDVIQDKHRR